MAGGGIEAKASNRLNVDYKPGTYIITWSGIDKPSDRYVITIPKGSVKGILLTTPDKEPLYVPGV